MTVRVADYIADFIYSRLKIPEVFMLTGAGIMHLTDGVASHPDLKAVCVHHEQSAAMAMDAYAKVNNHFAVGYFTTGPGATNALTGVAGAWQDSVPCLFIGGQVKLAEASGESGVPGLRQFGVQELNVLPMIAPVTKRAVMLKDPNQVRWELEKAVHVARSGRPGPVWLEVPMDIQAARIDPDALPGFEPDEPAVTVEPGDVAACAELLRGAERPVIIAGRGVRISGAEGLLAHFCEARDIPIVTPFLGVDNISHASPVYIGKTGVKGSRPANYAMQNADLILAIGSSLHVSVIGYEYEQFARAAKIVVVDIDQTSHRKKTIAIDRFIEADARAFLAELEKTLTHWSGPGPDWAERCRGWRERYPVCLPEYEELPYGVNIYTFVDRLCAKAGEGAIVISDAGSAFYAASQAVNLQRPGQRYVTSGAMATMGFSLPAAIGAACAHGEAGAILAITGDGSLQQNIQELQTLKHYGWPVKLFVLNNDGYLSIRASQNNYFDKRFIGESSVSGVSFPDTVRLAEVYGLKALRVERLADLDAALDRVLAADEPVVCDVVTPRNQEIIPTVSSKVNPDGSMSSRPLEDMYPFLEREEYLANLLVDEV